MHNKAISVVTINLNNAAGLEATIRSVLKQQYTALEFVVVDGDSTDGSKEVINKYADKIQQLLSEKDPGIYHAMNKGLAMASGDYVLFLNSGDTFYSTTALQQLMDGGDNADIVYGNLMVCEGASHYERVYPEKLSFSYFLMASLPHPATLVKKTLFNTVGVFFEDIKIAADWAFFTLAIVRHNCSYKHVPVVVTNFDLEGISSQESNLKFIEAERVIILQKYFPLFLDDYAALALTRQQLAVAKKQLGYRVYRKVKNIVSIKKTKK